MALPIDQSARSLLASNRHVPGGLIEFVKLLDSVYGNETFMTTLFGTMPISPVTANTSSTTRFAGSSIDTSCEADLNLSARSWSAHSTLVDFSHPRFNIGADNG
jgi:hypothetical protein